MGKKLAIEHHLIRPNEVIELLEMMGGKNVDNADGCSYLYYTLCTPKTNNSNNEKAICGFTNLKMQNSHFTIFTLEEFLEKYPFKIGDKVFDTADGDTGTIVDMKWDKDVSDMKYRVAFDNGDMGWYTNDTIGFLKKEDNLEETQSNQVVDNFRKEFCECCGSQRCSGQDDELEYCERFKNLMDNSGKPSVENHKMGPKSKLPSKYYEETHSKRDMGKTQSSHDKSIFIMEHSMWPIVKDGFLEYKIVDGYEVDKIENGNIILKPIKPKYPKTYEECCGVLGMTYDYPDIKMVSTDECSIYSSFIELIRCRDAYWKIAGKEMGLGKPWKPDWNDEIQKYCIRTDRNKIVNCSSSFNNRILAFPTEEMRDAFYENFKDLIEQCKELL